MKCAFAAYCLVALCLSPLSSSAQVGTGLPPFSSLGGGPFDTVNLGSLNTHFSIPIVHKAGRGLPFSYDLQYDSLIYQKIYSGGTYYWQPTSTQSGIATYWGWQGLGPAYTPYVSYKTTYSTGNCTSGFYRQWTYTAFAYHDEKASVHPFNAFGTYTLLFKGCTLYSQGADPPGVQSMQAVDASGYTLNVSYTGTGAAGSINGSSGTKLSVPFFTGSPSSSPYTATDANGNEVTFNSTNGQYMDTLGTTVLTVAGVQPSPTLFTYASPAGSNSYQVNYTPYNIQTNFACGSTHEYSATNISLVSSIGLPDGSQYTFQYEDTPGFSGYKTGRISQITLPTGGTISYSYTYAGLNDGINCSDGTTSYVQRTLTPGGVWQYSRSGSGASWTTTVNDPNNNQTAISFEEWDNNFYETQRLAYAGSTGGTLVSTAINCYNGQNVGTPSNCPTTPITTSIARVTTFRYWPSASGITSETDSIYDAYGLIHEVDEYNYGTAGHGVGGVARKTITTYWPGMGNGIVDRPETVTIEDSGGTPKAYTAYWYDEGTPTSTTSPQHVSVSGSRGNLTTVQAQANSSTSLWRHYTYYDTGMLNTSTDVSTSQTNNGAPTTYTYGSGSCGNSFVTSIGEPVGGMSRSFTWDCNGGVLLSITDENNNATSTAYSGTNYTNVFWRPYSTTDEAGTVTDYFYYLSTATPPVEFQSESKYHTPFNSGQSTVDRVTTTDGFGRTLFRQTRQSPNSSSYDTVATCYDNFGRTSLTTLPFSGALVSSASTCPSTAAGTAYLYYGDALGRTETTQDNYTGGAVTTFTYNENDTLETRVSPSVSKQSEYDALGRLTSVCEITSGTTAWPSASCGQNTSATGYLTTYGYDVLGNRTAVAQNAQASAGHQTRGFIYDMLNRLTSETNPENNNTAITYSYDSLTNDSACGSITSAGNLVKGLDANGNAVCYSAYDALHRVGTVTYPSSSTPSKYFIYDSATVNSTNMTNAKTRLAEAYTCIGGCSSKQTDLAFSYWPTGQQSDVWEMTPHSGTNYYYHVTATPWPNGTVDTISNLVGLPTITYGADGEGRVSNVSASSGQNPVTSISYNPASKVTAITYGSSDSDSFTLDPNTYRITQYQFSVGSSPTTDTGALQWNANGSLQSLTITDQINSANNQTCNYTHDDLGRAASINCTYNATNVWNQNFTYDPFGNITKTIPNGGTGTGFNPGYDYSNYTNRMTSTPFTYNGNNGALTADSSHSYAWDTANRLSSIDSGGNSAVCVIYDALDRPVEQAKGSGCNSGYTEVIYSPGGAKLALMNASTLTNAFVNLPGGAQAVYGGSGLQYYRHPDWLGSSRLSTTPSRTCYWDIAYAPFGENYAPPSSGCTAQDLNFTGQNQDTESSNLSGGQGGLYDFMFRRHSPVQGRWLSPDPAGIAAANPSDPQTWNRYAYAANRPTNTVDAMGLDSIEPCEPGDCGGGGDPCDPIVCGCDPVFGCGCDPGIDPLCGLPPLPPPLPAPPPIETPQPQRVGGVWPDNETLGLPGGLNAQPFGNMRNLFGLTPNLGCGDFVACNTIGSDGFIDPQSCTWQCWEQHLIQKRLDELIDAALWTTVVVISDYEKLKCDARFQAEKDYCSLKYWGTPYYGACRDRAFWRYSNCLKGVEDPGPLDPLAW